MFKYKINYFQYKIMPEMIYKSVANLFVLSLYKIKILCNFLPYNYMLKKSNIFQWFKNSSSKLVIYITRFSSDRHRNSYALIENNNNTYI